MLIGALAMKYFIRQVPVRSLAAILFWATVRVQAAVFAFILLSDIFKISIRPLSGLLNLLALCAIGWLVTRHLSRNYGLRTNFPAVGTMVVATVVIVTLLIVIAIIVMTGA